MSTDLERYQAPSIDNLYRYAKAYAVSKMFPDIQSAEQAFVKISAGAELGLQPFQSMNGIDIIKGKPVVKPALLAGMLDNNDDYDYEIAWEDDACTVAIFKGGKKRGDSRFSMADAAKAGLAGKDNWQKFERNMLLSRAMSNAVRWYAPGLTMGPVYVEGEIPTGAPSSRVTATVTRPAPAPIPESDVIDVEPTRDFDPATEPPPPVVTPPALIEGEIPADIVAAGEAIVPSPLKPAGRRIDELDVRYLEYLSGIHADGSPNPKAFKIPAPEAIIDGEDRDAYIAIKDAALTFLPWRAAHPLEVAA